MMNEPYLFDFSSTHRHQDTSSHPLKLPSGDLGPDQFFWGNGKIILAGEYLVLEGGKALGLPTQWGQSLSVRYRPSFDPVLSWKSYDENGNVWLDRRFEFWRFNCLDEGSCEHTHTLQKILRQARKQNPHFLRDEVDVLAETRVSFPLKWGLGTSSTLIHNIASWAFTAPFELLFKTLGGSGVDVAIAQAEGPIVYEKKGMVPGWSHVQFDPSFKSELYFVYSGQKQNTPHAVDHFKKQNHSKDLLHKAISHINPIIEKMIACDNGSEFGKLMTAHEIIISELLQQPMIQKEKFDDFEGSIKSLGAWGGDFFLAQSKESYSEIEKYFSKKDCSTVIPYNQMILSNSSHHQSYVGSKNDGRRH